VVCSYTPTLSALIKPHPTPAEFRGILAVGQEVTAGSAPSPGTVAELDQIQIIAGHIPFRRLDGGRATSAAVLNAMQQYSWVHLACHASQNISDPTASAFQLHESELDLATIVRNPLKGAGLAFLSACQTATGDEKLPDEATHLAAGMIMAGYRTVIATMWSIKDEDAPTIAETFYSHLLEGGVPKSQKAAKALHDAVGHLRAKTGERDFVRWVPFVHIGE
jgi:CHAT domain-containing protein